MSDHDAIQTYINFDEYIRQGEPAQRERADAWRVAIGLQAVDGLETSEYLQKTARDNIDGKITIAEANELIAGYDRESHERDIRRYKEADLVSARIAAILSEKAFVFSVPQYLGTYRQAEPYRRDDEREHLRGQRELHVRNAVRRCAGSGNRSAALLQRRTRCSVHPGHLASMRLKPACRCDN